ncbi:MAG: acetoacetate--CoA ligase [Xanthomonadales bacterium]|nr:acetoacetate--CoA ligase [Xanthomonadales bacterium]
MSKPLWNPPPQSAETCELGKFIRYVALHVDDTIDDYPALQAFALQQPTQFWKASWDYFQVIGERGDVVLENADQMPGARWFPQARLNFAENLLRHRGGRDAISFTSETGSNRTLSHDELYTEVARTAQALRAHGIRAGDRVAGFLPNLPETIIAMLATTSIGAVWSSVSPDFGTSGVVDRLGQVKPRILFCTDAYQYNGKRFDCLERVREIRKQIPAIEQVVVIPYLDDEASTGGLEYAISYAEFTDKQADSIEFERLPFDHPVYIMFSSGTTGVPKCITHGAGGTLLQHFKELALHTDVGPQDRVFYFTTCGWMMWNWLVSNLALGATVVLFEGSPFYPAPDAMFGLAEKQAISIFGTGAKMISSWEKAGLKPRQSHDLAAMRVMLSTGSVLSPESFDFVYREIKPDLRLSSISGGTDIISCFVGGNPLLPVYRGEIQCAGLGMDVRVLRDDGSEADVDEAGELCCMAPFPSMPVFFWGDEDGSRYREAYFERFEGVWAHGDYIKRTTNDGYVIFGRSDATLNPGGVRIGTAEIYRQVEAIDEVLEAVCIGQDWDDDVRVVLFVKLREGADLDDALRQRIRSEVRANTTPRHVPAVIIQVPDIPRTVSGKITELAVRDVIHGRAIKNAGALANPEALDHFRNLPELRS